SLGVRGVPVFTYRHWVASIRKRVLPGSGDSYSDDTPDAVAHVKKHPALLHLLERWVAEQTAAMSQEIDVPAVRARWDQLAAQPPVPRLRKLLAWLEKADLAPAARHHAENVLRKLRKRAADVTRDLGEILTDLELLRGAFGGAVALDDLRATVSWA